MLKIVAIIGGIYVAAVVTTIAVKTGKIMKSVNDRTNKKSL